MTERQLIDVLIYINVVGGTATLHDDFDSPERVVIPAGRTTASFSIDFLADDEVEEDETVTFKIGDERTANATFTPVTTTFTIENDDSPPQPAETVDFTLRWEFSDPILSESDLDMCDIVEDMDMTIQTAGGAAYDDDLLDFKMTTLATCPETGTLTIADMNDGEEYEVWLLIFGGADYGDLSGMTVHVDYERANSDFNGTATIEDVFDTRMNGDGSVLLTIERNGNVITLKNDIGEVLGEGRIRNQPKLQKVKKRGN